MFTYTRRAHNCSVVILLKKVRYLLLVNCLTRVSAFFINTPSYNRDHLEYIHKRSVYDRFEYNNFSASLMP